MPLGETYIKIASQTLTSAATNVDFLNIPQTYTDIVAVVQVTNNGTNNERTLRVQVGNGSFDTGTNYSSTFLRGELTVLDSINVANNTFAYCGQTNSNNLQLHTINFMNYANSTTNKAFISKGSKDINRIDWITSLWRSNLPINQIRFSCDTNQWLAGSTFTLYGIAASVAPQASGGTITTDGTYWIHTFTSSGQFVPQQSIQNVDYLVVAGGGGAGGANSGWGCGGGGGGGLRCTVGATGKGGTLETPLSLTASTAYTVTVGAGGAVETIGGNSVFSTITSTGGGKGAAGQGGNGGTGGGSGGGFATGGTGTNGQGGNGGGGGTSGGAGGGGGASADGSSSAGTSFNGGNGGAGVTTSISGTSTTYGGGGGGSGSSDAGATGGTGGSGGGGNAAGATGNGVNGTANLGGGGGGARSGAGQTVGTGGSGIVIVRYPR